jgi:hypothetical protein
MKQGKVNVDRAFDALSERNALPDVFHLANGFASATFVVMDYIDAHPEIFGGMVDRDDDREYGDVHVVEIAVREVKSLLADEIQEDA